MDEHEAPLTTLLDAYRDAVLARNVDGFVALYDDEVRVFDLWGAWSYDGRDDWRRNVEGWFGSLGDERVAVTFESVRMGGDGPLAVVNAFVIYQALDAVDRPLRAMRNRLTWIVKRSNRGWRIVHEHTSAPVDGDTFKVRLSPDPG